MGKLERNISNIRLNKERRRKLRTEGTPAEAILWKAIQRRQILGKKFRRQYGIGQYIVDFYCPECQLVVELDGAPHGSVVGEDYEEDRTEYLSSLGVRIIRFENKTVYENLQAVLDTIRAALIKVQPPT